MPSKAKRNTEIMKAFEKFELSKTLREYTNELPKEDEDKILPPRELIEELKALDTELQTNIRFMENATGEDRTKITTNIRMIFSQAEKLLRRAANNLLFSSDSKGLEKYRNALASMLGFEDKFYFDYTATRLSGFKKSWAEWAIKCAHIPFIAAGADLFAINLDLINAFGWTTVLNNTIRQEKRRKYYPVS